MPDPPGPLSRPWDVVHAERTAAERMGKLAQRVFFGLLFASPLVVPLQCAAMRSGDYGPRTTSANQTVTELALLVAALSCAVIAALLGKALAHARRGKRALDELASRGDAAGEPDPAATLATLKAAYDETLLPNLRGALFVAILGAAFASVWLAREVGSGAARAAPDDTVRPPDE